MFTIITWSIFKMRSVSHKFRRDNQNTHFRFNKFLSENRTVYEIMRENNLKHATDNINGGRKNAGVDTNSHT